jgi:hypothetical protein
MVSNNTFVAEESSGSGAGTHGGADLITFQGNDFIGGVLGVQIRSPRTYIKGNNFKHNSIVSVFADFADNLQITDNTCIGNNKIDTLNQSAFIQINSNTKFSKSRPLIISRNVATGLRQGFLRLGGDFTLSGLRMTNNEIVFASNGTSFDVNLIYKDSGDPVIISESHIKDNPVTVERGIYSPLKNVVISKDRCSGDIIYQVSNSDFTKWTGTGNIDNVSVDVHQSVDKNNFTHVNGAIKFDVTGSSVAVSLKNLTRSNFSLTDTFISLEGHTLAINTNGELYIGYSEGNAYNTQFPVGTGYKVNFTLVYKVREGYEFN